MAASTPRPHLWAEVDNRTVNTDVLYSALAVLFGISPGATGVHLSVSAASGVGAVNATVQLMGQRLSDNVWVVLAEVSVTQLNSGSDEVDIPAGIYDNGAYQVLGLNAAGNPDVEVATALRLSAAETV